MVYARSTTFQARPSSIDAGIACMRDEVMPALQKMRGYIGMSLLVDRRFGRCIATSSWDSEKAMRATGRSVRPMGDRAAQAFSGSRTNVDEWEIAVLHRDHGSHEGAFARAAWFHVGPGQAERAIAFYRTSVLPSLNDLDGFCSASLMIERDTGRSVSTVTLDSAEAMDRNREKASALRNARVTELGARLIDVCEFELTIAHLRVPELV
jgi:heme-degrading monooxygenase HmoA